MSNPGPEVIHVVGTGLDASRLHPDMALVVDKAEVLAGGERLLKSFARHPAIRLPIRAPVSAVVDAVDRESRSGRRVVVLADGDPGFFGIGRTLIQALGVDRVQLHPNVTVLQAAAARIGTHWDDIRMVSLHGRSDLWPLRRNLAMGHRVGVTTDRSFHPAEIARNLIACGVENYSMVVFEDLGLPSERIRSFEDLSRVAGESFSAFIEKHQPRADSFVLSGTNTGNITLEPGDRILSQGNDALLVALPPGDEVSHLQIDGVQPQLHQLRDPQAGGIQHLEHRPIPNAPGGRVVRRPQESTDFLRSKIAGQLQQKPGRLDKLQGVGPNHPLPHQVGKKRANGAGISHPAADGHPGSIEMIQKRPGDLLGHIRRVTDIVLLEIVPEPLQIVPVRLHRIVGESPLHPDVIDKPVDVFVHTVATSSSARC